MESSEKKSAKPVSWQQRLLPFMIVMVGGLTLFFFLASVFQLFLLHKQIRESPELELSQAFDLLTLKDLAAQSEKRFQYTQWKTLSLLEAHTLKRRYHQANVLLMARVWVRYLGFVTGMILSLVGAAFILGKLREPESKFDAQGPWRVSIATTSPGLLLAVLGTLLMLTTMVIHSPIEVRDGPLYIPLGYMSSSTTRSLPPPADILPQIQETSDDLPLLQSPESQPNDNGKALREKIKELIPNTEKKQEQKKQEKE